MEGIVMKILVVQNTVCKHIEDTLQSIKDTMKSYDSDKIDFIVFPEMFTTPYEHKYFELYKQSEDDVVIQFLSELAKNTGSYVIGGSLPEIDNGKIYNTTSIFDRKGDLIAKYRKIHLFSITYPSGESFSEKEVLTEGNNIVT